MTRSVLRALLAAGIALAAMPAVADDGDMQAAPARPRATIDTGVVEGVTAPGLSVFFAPLRESFRPVGTAGRTPHRQGLLLLQLK